MAANNKQEAAYLQVILAAARPVLNDRIVSLYQARETSIALGKTGDNGRVDLAAFKSDCEKVIGYMADVLGAAENEYRRCQQIIDSEN